jgi:fatty-acyl-CoA synthase
MREAGFRVLHVYGLTECYGPAVTNEWHADWNTLAPAEQARLMARQGVRYLPLEALDVLDPATMTPVPPDGATMGEVMMRGNVVMKGYLKDAPATAAALAGGWFHTGRPRGEASRRLRPAPRPLQGHHHLRRREHQLHRGRGRLYRHPAVALAAVVAQPDEKWGEVPAPSSS